MALQIIIYSVLILTILFLSIKLIIIKLSIKEISNGLQEKLNIETNCVLDISSRNKTLRRFVSDLNLQLKKLYKIRSKCLSGDQEVKEAIINISHDLRTPLTAICGYMDLLEKEKKSDKVDEYLKIINTRVEALKQLTEELFKYSIFVGEEDENYEYVDINECLKESILDYYGALNVRGIIPEIEITPKKHIKLLNKTWLKRIFGNIISNAIKYSEGDLTIQLSESGKISFANMAQNLNEVTVGRLFDRFFTVENAKGSTGLGLSIARILTEKMKGTIKAEYQDNKLVITLSF